MICRFIFVYFVEGYSGHHHVCGGNFWNCRSWAVYLGWCSDSANVLGYSPPRVFFLLCRGTTQPTFSNKAFQLFIRQSLFITLHLKQSFSPFFISNKTFSSPDLISGWPFRLLFLSTRLPSAATPTSASLCSLYFACIPPSYQSPWAPFRGLTSSGPASQSPQSRR